MGGAGGHMRHPHDLDEVEDGKDLIALFKAVPEYLRSKNFQTGDTTSLKLDGSNISIKVAAASVGDDIQFGIDRASHEAIDVNGVTLDKLKERFPKNPSMALDASGLIGMMNQTYREDHSTVKELLKVLGLLDINGAPDTTKFINIEYIKRASEDIDPETGLGRANAVKYSFDSITFLNISQFYEVWKVLPAEYELDPEGKPTKKGKKVKGKVAWKDEPDLIRRGLERPMIKYLDDDGIEREKIESNPSVAVKGFNRKALDSLAALAQEHAPIANGKPMRVLGPSNLELRIAHGAPEWASEEEISDATEGAIKSLENSIEETLNTNITIRLDSEGTEITKTLRDWLKDANNVPYLPYINLTDEGMRVSGMRINKISPFAKKVHQQLINNQFPLFDYVQTRDLEGETICNTELNSPRNRETDCEKAIFGAIFYEAAIRLGRAVQGVLIAKEKDFAATPTVDHEGIVINPGFKFGNKKTKNTFKLTGEFIVKGTEEGLYADRGDNPPGARDDEESEWYSPEHETRADAKFADRYGDGGIEIDIIDDEDADPVVDVDFPAEPKIIALVPGSFKPPTRGHLEMVKWYADRADEVRVIISQPTQNVRPIPGVRPKGVTVGDAMKIWELMTAGIPGVTIDKSDKASPMQVVFDEIRDDDEKIPPRSTVLLGASEKVDDKENPDWHRWVGAEEYARKDERGLPVFAVKYGGEAAAPVVYHSDDYMGLLRDLQEENHPIVQGLKQKDQEAFHASDMRYLISKAITENSMEARALLDDFVVDDVGEFLELFAIDLKEMSSMAGGPGAVGDVGGYSGVPFGRSSPVKKRRKKRRKKKKNESIDLSLIDEIYELLSERGVIQ